MNKENNIKSSMNDIVMYSSNTSVSSSINYRISSNVTTGAVYLDLNSITWNYTTNNNK